MDLRLPARLAEVREEIARCQAQAGLSHPVTIVAVTKTWGAETVREVVEAGLTDVGENRVQEALAKQDELPGLSARWHLIGSLQRNKARHVAGRFELIHSVDRISLARELDRRAAPGKAQRVLIQVNCSAEPQKGGVAPADLLALVDQLVELPGLALGGLMTMAPLTEDEALQRSTFAMLRNLRDQVARPGLPLSELSMGMSGDYRAAVMEGATMVRLGTALLGDRQS